MIIFPILLEKILKQIIGPEDNQLRTELKLTKGI